MIDSNPPSNDVQSNDLQEDTEDEVSSEPGYLQEFGFSIMNICKQEQEGQLSSKEAYQQIKAYWKELKQSRKKQKGKDQKGKH